VRHVMISVVSGIGMQELIFNFFFSSRRRHTRFDCDWSSDVCSSDLVVLACTHFPLLLSRLERLAPWPVNFIDPAPAIARRVVELSGPPTRDNAVPARAAFFTSGRPASPALGAALARFGIAR